MKIPNIFKINDWPFNKFIILVSIIQVSVIGTFALDNLGIKIPFLIPILGFIYLTFIPGTIILRIFKLHELDSTENFLYSIGLSLATIMFYGFALNMVLPFLGIKNPISFNYLIISWTILIIILIFISFLIDRKYKSKNEKIDIKFSNKLLFLFLLPFIAILGTYVMNNYNNNIILIFLLVIISISLLLVSFEIIPQNLYPLTIFIISLSLIYHTSLISNYIWGWDINTEYYFANLVLKNNLWNYNIGGNVNAMLSITFLGSIYSIILKTDLIWILKIIYPFLYSLVPLGLFKVFQKQTNDKIAFFACFLFISLFMFYAEMPMLARQQIAEFFLVLMLMVIINKKIDLSKTFLLVIFSFSLIVSHYGLSYIFLLMLLVAFLFSNILNLEFIYKQTDRILNIGKLNFNFKTTKNSFLLLFLVCTLSWYIYVSESSSLFSIINILNNITGNLRDILNPSAVEGFKLVLITSDSYIRNFSKYMHLFMQFLIILGIVSVLLYQIHPVLMEKIRTNINREFMVYSLMSIFILILSLTVPFFASSLNTSRIYHISLIFLAPFCILGFIALFNVSKQILKKEWSMNYAFHIFALILIIFFSFNNGLIYEISNDNPGLPLELSQQYPIFNEKEVNGGNWLNIYGVESLKAYSDYKIMQLLTGFTINYGQFPLDLYINDRSYQILGTQNIIEGSGLIKYKGESVVSFNNTLNKKFNQIYDNKGFIIFINN